MAIRTKAELIALYADNVSGDISASDLRDFVNSNLSLEFLNVTSTPVTAADTTDIIIGLTGVGTVNLPLIASFKDRALIITNDSGSFTMTIDPDGIETIAGLSSLTMLPGRAVFLYSELGSTDWNIIIDNLGQFINLQDTPTSYVSDPNKFLRVDALSTQVTFQDTEFTFNADTPSSFSGAANQHVTVNGGETALVFTDAVDSFISRTGAVVAAASDYDASQVDNDSTVTGAFVDDALNQLDTDIGNKPDDFLELTDTPSTYTSQGGKTVNVNGGETALEFVDPIDDFLDLTDTPSSYTSQAGKTVNVNGGATALEFVDPINDFLDLTDTPSSYSGQGSTFVKVNAGETALEFVSDAGAVFGTEYEESESDAESNTSSSTFQDKLTLVTATVPAGDYHIGFYAEIANSSAEDTTEVRCTVDAVEVAQMENETKDNDNFVSFGGFKISTLTNAAHTLKIQFRRGTSGTAAIRRARIEIWRVS